MATSEGINVATPTRELRTLSVCSGAGGLELGLRLAGLPTRVVGYVEREVSVVDILASRFEDGTLEPAPVWSDVRTVHTVLDAFGSIDAVVGGYPCQPFSHAGRRAGADDPRHLWPSIRDLVERVGPSLCVFENVDGHVTKGLDVVVGDLEDLGYVVEAGIFSAAEVGAPHLRKRLFIAAVLADSVRDVGDRLDREEGGGRRVREVLHALADGVGTGLEGRPRFGSDDEPQRSPVERSGGALVHPDGAERRASRFGGRSPLERLDPDGQADGRPRVADATLADAVGGAAQRRGVAGELRDATSVAHHEGDQRQRSGDAPDDGVQDVVDTALIAEREPGDGACAESRGDTWPNPRGRWCGVFPPGPEDYAVWERILADDATLAPALPDLAGRSGKEVLAAQPDLCRVADGLADRLDEHFANRAERLQALGNGVVPACAGVSVSVLLARIARRLGGVA